jgi:hypothetical protein
MIVETTEKLEVEKLEVEKLEVEKLGAIVEKGISRTYNHGKGVKRYIKSI